METPATEGAVGGKIRRRPLRQAPATPYDRPLRAPPGGDVAAEGTGCVSSPFFSVFRKRAEDSDAAVEEDRQSRDVSQIVCTIPSSVFQNGDRDGNYRAYNSGCIGIAEHEILVKKKMFKRVESDWSTEMLHSRTVGPSKVEHENSNEKNGKARVSARKDRIGSLKVPEDETISPVDVAKAYMASRSSKASPSVGNFRNQFFQEGASIPSIPSTSKRLAFSVVPRSVISFSGTREHPTNDYQTGKTSDRSTVYRMSRSPYFKANLMKKFQVGESSRNGYFSPPPSSSQWASSAMKSGGRQVLKRGRSALEGDFGSCGPIRRIRQKCNLMSPSRVAHTSQSGNFPSSSSSPLSIDVSKGSMPVLQSLLLDELNTGSQAIKNEVSSATMLAPQSSEIKQKFFQQLDRLFPSPIKKSSELKTISRDEPPSKLTLDMLHGSALRSMEDANKLFVIQQSGTACASHLLNFKSYDSQELGVVEENAASLDVGLRVRSASEFNGAHNTPMPSEDAKPGLEFENITGAISVGLPVCKEQAFQMSAPEDSLELDDDDCNIGDLSYLSTTEKDEVDTKMSHRMDAINETSISEHSLTTLPILNSVSFKKADNLVQFGDSEKPHSFAFPLAVIPLSDKADVPKEQVSSIFSLGTKGVNPSISSPITNVNDSASTIVGYGSGSEVISSTSGSVITNSREGSTLDKGETEKAGFGNTIFTGVSTSSAPALATLDKGETEEAGLGSAVSSGVLSTLSMPAILSSGICAAPTLSDGSLQTWLPKLPVSVTAAATLSEGPVSSISTDTSASTYNPSSSSVSSSAVTLSTVPMLQFGSGIAMTTPVSVSQPLDVPNSLISGGNSVKVDKASPFVIPSSMAKGISSMFPGPTSSSSDVGILVTNSSSASSSPALSTSAISSDLNSSSSATSLFSSMAGSCSVASSSAFPSIVSSVFSFCPSTQSTGSTPSSANSFSQYSTAITFGATGGSTGSGPLFDNSSSLKFTFSSNSGSEGSIFGTQLIKPGCGTSQITQSSTSQFSTFYSSPSFGQGNSSLGSLGTSPSASSTLGTSPSASSTLGTTGFSFSSGAGSSGFNSSSSSAPVAIPSLLGSSSQASFGTGNSSVGSFGTSLGSFGTSLSAPATSSATGFFFSSGAGSSDSITSLSFATLAANSMFGSSSQASTSSVVASSSFATLAANSMFGSSSQASTSSVVALSSSPSTSPSNGFSFGSSACGSSCSPLAFGSSSSSVFSFTSAGATVSSNPSFTAPVFGSTFPTTRFGSSSPGNDRMNEDSMTDDTSQAGTSLVPTFGRQANQLPVPTFGQQANQLPAPTFGQQANQLPAPNFGFGASSVQPAAASAFQFGSHQNASLTQNPSPFQSVGNVGFNPVGSFSLGSGDGDKSGRRFVRAKRNKQPGRK